MDKKMAAFIGIGFEIVILLVAAVFLGQKADQHFGLKGLGMPLAVIAALVAWICHLVVLVRQLNANEDKPDSSSTPPST